MKAKYKRDIITNEVFELQPKYEYWLIPAMNEMYMFEKWVSKNKKNIEYQTIQSIKQTANGIVCKSYGNVYSDLKKWQKTDKTTFQNFRNQAIKKLKEQNCVKNKYKYARDRFNNYIAYYTETSDYGNTFNVVVQQFKFDRETPCRVEYNDLLTVFENAVPISYKAYKNAFFYFKEQIELFHVIISNEPKQRKYAQIIFENEFQPYFHEFEKLYIQESTLEKYIYELPALRHLLGAESLTFDIDVNLIPKVKELLNRTILKLQNGKYRLCKEGVDYKIYE